MSARHCHPCDGLCNQGRACPARAPVTPIRTLEQEHPWVWWLYAAAVVAGFVLTMLMAGCGGSDDKDDNADDKKELITPPNCPASGVCR